MRIGVSSGRTSGLDIWTFLSDISVMTETTNIEERTQAAILAPAVARFILHWGDMGSQWGVNRSVAQIHALLYLSARPMTAEDIADQLGLARSNVSNSLKELIGWKLIARAPQMGDRRDFYVAETDLWEMVTRIAAGRKEREIDPAMAALELCVAESEGDRSLDPVAAHRLTEMLGFLRTIDGWYGQMLGVPAPKLMALIRMGAKIVRFLK
jgi:DNA-binding transcriptional regulator GbsR (MarR family)